MANRTISILGCGWLGKSLGSVLADGGYPVAGSTTRSENAGVLEDLGITPFIFAVDDLASGNIPESFFHADVLVISLPHRVRMGGKGDEYVAQIKRVVNEAVRGGVKKVLLFSTTSVYPNLGRMVTEEDADPQNPIVKAERVVLESGIPGTVIRLAGLYGPGRDPGKFLSGKSDIKGWNVPVNLIHRDDCIEIIKRIIEMNVWNTVLNACADEHPTRKEFYTRAAVAIGSEPPKFSEEQSAEYKIVSNERLKTTTGYTFIHKLI